MTRREAAIDIAIVVAAVGAGWAITRLALYPALGIPDYFPAILRPILGFAAACALLYRRGAGWGSLGLRKPANAWIAIAGAVALYAANWALSRWALPALAELVQPTQQPSFLGYLRANFEPFALWVALDSTPGRFIEAMLFR